MKVIKTVTLYEEKDECRGLKVSYEREELYVVTKRNFLFVYDIQGKNIIYCNQYFLGYSSESFESYLTYIQDQNTNLKEIKKLNANLKKLFKFSEIEPPIGVTFTD